MRTSTAYFAGVGTVVVAIAAGLGGGVILANVMNPNPSHQQTSRLDQHMSAQAPAASNRSDEKGQQQSQSPVPSVAASQTAATPAASEKNQTQPQTPAQPVQAGNSQPKAATATPAPQPVPHQETVAIDDANAKDTNKDTSKDVNKTRDADLKRQADQRKNDRQRQWADRRKRDQQQRDQQQQQRDQDLRDAQARMQDDDRPRDAVVRRDWRNDRRSWRDDRDAREDDGPPVTRFGAPAFGLFGSDD
jgi:hypothetical protein